MKNYRNVYTAPSHTSWREGCDFKGCNVYSISATFDLLFDTTDHFAFYCHNCKVPATIYHIYRNDAYANEPTLYIQLYCPQCKGRGQRKTYIEDRKPIPRLHGMYMLNRAEGYPSPLK